MSDTTNFRGDVPRPDDSPLVGGDANVRRPLAGLKGWDLILELGRQGHRNVLALITSAALADNFLFASWWRHGQGRLDEMSLAMLIGLALGLAGLRSADLGVFRR